MLQSSRPSMHIEGLVIVQSCWRKWIDPQAIVKKWERMSWKSFFYTFYDRRGVRVGYIYISMGWNAKETIAVGSSVRIPTQVPPGQEGT